MPQNMDKTRSVITIDNERLSLPASRFLAPGNYTLNADGSITIGGGGLSAFKTAGTSRSASVALADDPDLIFAAVPAGTYAVLAAIQAFSTSATPDIRCGFRANPAPITPSMMGVSNFSVAGLTGEDNGGLFAVAPSSMTPFTLVANQPGLLLCQGMLVIPVDTDVAFMWAQATSDATATAVRAGSYMTLSRLD